MGRFGENIAAESLARGMGLGLERQRALQQQAQFEQQQQFQERRLAEEIARRERAMVIEQERRDALSRAYAAEYDAITPREMMAGPMPEGQMGPGEMVETPQSIAARQRFASYADAPDLQRDVLNERQAVLRQELAARLKRDEVEAKLKWGRETFGENSPIYKRMEAKERGGMDMPQPAPYVDPDQAAMFYNPNTPIDQRARIWAGMRSDGIPVNMGTPQSAMVAKRPDMMGSLRRAVEDAEIEQDNAARQLADAESNYAVLQKQAASGQPEDIQAFRDYRWNVLAARKGAENAQRQLLRARAAISDADITPVSQSGAPAPPQAPPTQPSAPPVDAARARIKELRAQGLTPEQIKATMQQEGFR